MELEKEVGRPRQVIVWTVYLDHFFGHSEIQTVLDISGIVGGPIKVLPSLLG